MRMKRQIDIKNNICNLKIVFLLFIVAICFIHLFKGTYSRYVITKDTTISISSGKYYFNISSNRYKITDSINEIQLTADNFQDNNVSTVDITYSINIDNPKFEISVNEGSLNNRVLKADGTNKNSETYKLKIVKKSGETVNETETINVGINVSSPFGNETKKIVIQYSNIVPKLQIELQNNPLRISKGNTSYMDIIKNNCIVKDDSGNIQTDAKITCELSSDFDINKISKYKIKYIAEKDGYITATNEVEAIVCTPPSIDFFTGSATDGIPEPTFILDNAVASYSSGNSIVHVRSTSEDPKMTFVFAPEHYFSPKEYRYVIVRYRCSSNQSNLMGLYTSATPTSQTYFAYRIIKSDGLWHELKIDLWSLSENESGAIKNQDWCDGGIRFDFTNNGNIDMDIDYIRFLKEDPDTHMEYAYFEGFDTQSYQNYTYVGLNILSCQNSVLSLTATTNDPQISMTLPENSYFDQKKYKFLYVTYSISTASDNMRFYFRLNEDYAIGMNITGGGLGRYHTVVFDLSANSNVWNLENITNWRFDPLVTPRSNY